MPEDKLESYKRTLGEMRKLREGPLQDIIKANQEKAKAEAREARQILVTTASRFRDEIAHLPQNLDSEMDMEAAMKSLNPSASEVMINKWDDGRGNILFASGGVDLNQISSLYARITEQKGVFDTLGTDDQTQIRAAFNLAVPTASTTPYQDFLKSEALGKRFQELKQKNTPPK